MGKPGVKKVKYLGQDGTVSLVELINQEGNSEFPQTSCSFRYTLKCFEIQINLKSRFDQGVNRVLFWSDSLGVSRNKDICSSALNQLITSDRSVLSAVLWAGPQEAHAESHTPCAEEEVGVGLVGIQSASGSTDSLPSCLRGVGKWSRTKTPRFNIYK